MMGPYRLFDVTALLATAMLMAAHLFGSCYLLIFAPPQEDYPMLSHILCLPFELFDQAENANTTHSDMVSGLIFFSVIALMMLGYYALLLGMLTAYRHLLAD